MLVRVMCLALCLSPWAAAAAGSAEPEADTGAPQPRLNANLEVASAYLFRGQNVYKRNGDSPEREQALRLSPSLTWQVNGSGLTAGYWGAFQGAGSNLRDNIKAGVGAEQDLWIELARQVREDLEVRGSVLAYAYPFADSGEEWAGTACPLYLEPQVGVTRAGTVDVGFNLSWLTGVQPSLREGSYLYLNPVLATQLPLPGGALTGDLTAGLGYRIGTNGRIDDYRCDALVSLTVPYPLSARWYLGPTLALAWGSRRGVGLGDEAAVWVALNVGRDQ